MIRLDAPIVAVTVYPGQARVTRRGRVSLPGGDARVLVTGLPTLLHPDSVRVAGTGAATVLGVDVAPEPHARPTTAPDLRERADALDAALAEIADTDTVLGTRADLLAGVARRSATALAQAVARGEADAARVAAAGEGLAGELARVLGERRELATARERVLEERDEVQRLLAQRSSDPDLMAVAVDLSGDGDVDLEVSYVVDGANWESRYDVRLTGDRLTLAWFALVTQHTGEDWPECELALSTARPTAGVSVPELSPWFLDVLSPVVPMPAAAGPKMRGGYGAAMAMPAPAAVAAETAAVEHGVTANTYRPRRPVAVPADGSAHRATVAALELDARVDHVTAPVQGPEVYLRATAVNTSEHTLRPGRAALFHDAEYVGATRLDAWAPGEELELALGVDDRVRVERELVRRSTGKAVLGGTRRLEAAYRTTVTNHSPRQARVAVVDQVPVSRHESVVVRDVTLRPEPAERDELGRVTWRLDLAPGASADLDLAVRVDVAKGVDLRGWRD
ncbi:mucoidy inhibitor MuiA family protein [Actinokineospora sp. UTMC 2448]|uniref:mucoidy inhibitor MuiA family protein n=1 Tax=Actinokineospora sp. UTMC 2448 TaxID=2268449 RepID=UPI002164B599|nr:mucoidy inhibitor MuiA family protein [Actinokineospora sp. UTMC 2448]